jgi:two-component system, OmpR family, sensor histidine kinase MtrB
VLRLSFEMLREPSLVPGERAAILDRVGRQLHRLERMTADFLDRAQIESGRVELKLETLDARDLVARSCELFIGATEVHRIVRAVPEQPIRMRGDALRIEQILTNLVSNAVKYSPQGGDVVVRVRGESGVVVFSVVDGGVGLTEEERRTIFEPFQRAPRMRSEVPGTGLGLSVVSRLVEAHRGTIQIHSELGRGSTFEVRLPGVDAPDPSRHSAEPVATRAS